MTTTSNRNEGKTRDRHSTPSRNTTRPPPIDANLGLGGTGKESKESTSADEIRETVKEAVGKGVAAVAGAAEGISETMEETHLQETAESAVRQVGQTAHKVVRAAKEETENIKEAFRGEGQRSGDQAVSGESGLGGSTGGPYGSGGLSSFSQSGSGSGSESGSSLSSGSEPFRSSSSSDASPSGSMPYGSGETRSTLDTSEEDEDESKGI